MYRRLSDGLFFGCVGGACLACGVAGDLPLASSFRLFFRVVGLLGGGWNPLGYYCGRRAIDLCQMACRYE